MGVSPEGFHRVAYTEWGSYAPQLPTVICVHGLTRNSRDFDGLAGYLSNKDRYVLCPDVVGRGESSWFTNPSNYTFPQYIADMNALIARSGADTIDWVGTSMGGLIGMMMAAIPNSPIRRLVLNDIGPQIPIVGLKRLAKYAGKDPVFHTITEAKNYFKLNYEQFGELTEQQWDELTKHSIKYLPPNLHTINVDPGIRHPKSGFQLFIDILKHPHKSLEGICFDVDLWSIWQKIRCPVLVIHGKRSDLLTEEIIIKMRQTHPYIEVYNIENAGHAPALLEEKTQEFIYNWLKLN